MLKASDQMQCKINIFDRNPSKRRHTDILYHILLLLFTILNSYLNAQCDCDSLPPPPAGETIIYVNNTPELLQAIHNASGKTTIYLNSGIYAVDTNTFINVTSPDITIRSTTGNRNDVIIQGMGMSAVGTGIGIYINNDNITIANLTVKDVQNHAFFVTPGSDSSLFHNVAGIDCGEQIFKASGTNSAPPKNGGVIQCSEFKYTTTLDDGDDGWYTNGIDLLNCHNWVIRDNFITNIRHNPSLTSTLAGPAILVWHSSSGTLIERNRILHCDYGISLGNAGQGSVSHTGGIIKNNFITGHSGSDFGIGLIYAPDAKVINNTVYSPGGWPHSIEARFSQTNNVIIMNNITDEHIWDDRDGASCILTTNYTNVSATDFDNVNHGNLHLNAAHVWAVDAGTATNERLKDIDCGNIQGTPDIGADEFNNMLSLHRSHKISVKLFPNPTPGIFHIEGTDIDYIVIWDMNGQLIHKKIIHPEDNSISLKHLKAGYYIVEMYYGNTVQRRKLILR